MNGEQTFTLDDGGFVTVVLARGIEMPEGYKDHPRVKVLEGHGMSVLEAAGKVFTENSRGVIMAGRLRPELYEKLLSAFKMRKHPWLYRPNPTALEAELRRLLGRPTAATAAIADATTPAGTGAKEIAKKGEVRAIIDKHDDTTLSITESARKVFNLAKAQGIPTTLASVAQGVSKYRRDRQSGSRPMSAMDPAKARRLNVLKLLDDTIAGFTLLREYVATTEEENEKLRQRLERAKKAASVMLGDE